MLEALVIRRANLRTKQRTSPKGNVLTSESLNINAWSELLTKHVVVLTNLWHY